jgi:hypothetical protein
LGDKEWPLGGGIGVAADVEYIFGSDKAPSFNMKEASFDKDKFMDRIVHDDMPDKQKRADEQPAPWKEKNTTANERKVPEPDKAAKKPLSTGAPAVPHAKPVQPPSTRSKEEKEREVPPSKEKHDTPQGVEHALDKQQADKEKALQKIPPRLREPADAEAKKPLPDPVKRWERGVTAVRQALSYAEVNGIELNELNRILIKIKNRPEYGFTDLHAEEEEDDYVVLGDMSPGRKITKSFVFPVGR